MTDSSSLPEVLTLPLRERMRRIEAGELDPAAVAEINDWAWSADSRYRACTQLHPATELPVRVGVKDTVAVAGFATRLGTRRYRDYPRRSAAVLRGLPPGSITAKLTTTELSIGLEHGCLNPYFPHLDPGGSSTGCAVAVAANVCDLAMGTDTVASVRIPAAACGVVGLRLTSDTRLLDGIFGLSPHLDAPGWITRTADDLAFLWANHDLSLGLAPRGDRRGARFRVGVVAEALDDDVDPEIRSALIAACDALEAAHHTVAPVRLGELFHRRGLAYELCAREAADVYQRQRTAIADVLAPSTLRALESGAAVDHRRYGELLETHFAFRREAARRFNTDGLDVWLMPAGTMMPRNIHTETAPDSTIPDTPERGDSTRVNYAALASFLGLPSITFPVAHSQKHNAPVGLLAVGPSWTEETLIDLAVELTRLTGDIRFDLGGTPDRRSVR